MAMKVYSENALAAKVDGYKSSKKTEIDPASENKDIQKSEIPQHKESKQEIRPIIKTAEPVKPIQRTAGNTEKTYEVDELLKRNKKKKGPKDVLSIRVDRDKLVLWKSYCDVFDVSLSSILIDLMDRFIKENPVPSDEELFYYENARELTQEIHKKNDKIKEWTDTIDQKLGSKIEKIKKKITE